MPTERLLALEKGIKFVLAMGTANCARRHDWNEKGGFGDRPLDFICPQRAVRNCRRVLPQPDIAPQLQTQFVVDARPQPRQGSARMLVVTARIAEKADKLWKFGQRRHRATQPVCWWVPN